jgi:hypothetical protein
VATGDSVGVPSTDSAVRPPGLRGLLLLSFSDAGPTKVSPQARGPASEKLQRTKPRWGSANFANNHERNSAASGNQPQTDFRPCRARKSMQLRRSGTNIALNGDFTFCALNDSNDLRAVKGHR